MKKLVLPLVLAIGLVFLTAASTSALAPSGVSVDPSTPAMAQGGIGRASSIASNAFSPPANSTILVLVGNAYSSSAPTSITDSLDTNLTYTLDQSSSIRRTSVIRRSATVAAYIAQVGSTAPGSMTVTASFARTIADASALYILPVVLDGAQAATAAVNSQTWTTSATPSVSLTPQDTGSLVFGLGVNNTTIAAGAPSSGQTLLGSLSSASTLTSAWVQDRNVNTTAGTVVTLSDTNSLPSGLFIGVEVPPAENPPSSPPPSGNTPTPPATSSPTMSPVAVSKITGTSATFTTTVNPNGVATSVVFEYGPTTSYGSTTAPQNIGSGTTPQTVTANVTGLPAGKTEHVRADATQ
jgi:hypothetical protein